MSKIAPSGQTFERRQLVAKMDVAGEFRIGHKKYRIWKYMTFWTGGGPSIAAEFVRPADIDKNGFLRLETLKPGEIVVDPGLIYRKIPMTGMIMEAHLRAMKVFKPKPLLHYEKDKGPAIDMGSINLTGKETIQ